MPWRLLERGDGLGGRVRTDLVDGFRLDRGFQVLLTAYPEAKDVLDYNALSLKAYIPGALIRRNGRFSRVADPFRRPLLALSSLFDGPGSLFDKLRVLGLRRTANRGTLPELLARPEVSTRERLQQLGFGRDFVQGFVQPWLGGVFSDPELETTSRMLEFVFRWFAKGDTAIPELGMGEIPAQLASTLPSQAIALNTEVTAVGPGEVRTTAGRLEARAVVVATEAPAAAQLLHGFEAPAACPTTTVYFAAPRDPVGEASLVLDGEGTGPVNHLAVPSAVSPALAPAGQALVAANVLGPPPPDDDALVASVRAQLRAWFGADVDAWRVLRIYRIPYALPAQGVGALEPSERPVRFTDGIYLCGDHRDTGSIQGAMVSGRRSAQAIMADA